jgi:pyruvate formate lyase activating enzyme
LKKADARFWKKEKQGIKCFACHRSCMIADGKTGFCGVRKNISGKLVSLVYGRTITLSIDPVEKKPLFHFKPGSECLGISTFGCNFSCMHCQNHEISQQKSEQAIKSVPVTTPEEIVEKALFEKTGGIAYTYTEPTVFAEYAFETMKLASKKGLYNVWVSNGYMGKELVHWISPFLDAINIDLKGNSEFYKKICGGIDRKKVLDNIRLFHSLGVHVEVTNLIVPGYNDSEKDFQEVSDFIASIDNEIPLHFTRFFPHYNLKNIRATPFEKLEKAKEIAEKKGLAYVYNGNIGLEENTYCKKCGALLVERGNGSIKITGLENSKCTKCKTKNNIIL